jgi:hypothetical protein
MLGAAIAQRQDSCCATPRRRSPAQYPELSVKAAPNATAQLRRSAAVLPVRAFLHQRHPAYVDLVGQPQRFGLTRHTPRREVMHRRRGGLGPSDVFPDFWETSPTPAREVDPPIEVESPRAATSHARLVGESALRVVGSCKTVRTVASGGSKPADLRRARGRPGMAIG